MRIKPYSCKECVYKTSRRKDLINHINAIHRSIKTHFCKECSFKTSYINSLNEHIDTTHRCIKRYVCNYCNSKLVQKVSLLSHLVTKHNKAKDFDIRFNDAGGDLAKIKSCDCGYKCLIMSRFVEHIKCCKEISVGKKRLRSEN